MECKWPRFTTDDFADLMDCISLMALAMQTQLKKHHKKTNKQKKSHAHCCLLFSLFDDLSGTHLGFSNSA